MRNIFGIIPALITSFLASCSVAKTDSLTISNLRCEFMNESLTEKRTPRLSWELSSAETGQRQTAWQVILSDDRRKLDKGRGDIWNSGKKSGSETFGIIPDGKKLASFRKYYWKVRIWDRDGKVTGWSDPASVITGAFDSTDWRAAWIGDKPEPPLEYPLVHKHIGYLSAYAPDENEEKWVQIDLGRSASFNRIRLYPSFNNIRKITDYYFPSAFRIETCDDGINWKKYYSNSSLSMPGGKPVQIDQGKIQARYIRFTAERLKRYDHRIRDYEDQGDPSRMYAFSLAELEVIDGERVISKGCDVSCRDAVVKLDREDGYDPDMLTDGITDTPPYPEKRATPPSPMIRKSISLKAMPAQAIAYVSATGIYELTFNGKTGDGRVLAPEWTDYKKRVQYQAYDVTDLLSSGENVIGAMLADGWFAGMLGPVKWSEYFPKRGAYGLDRKFLFQMKVIYADGSVQTILSDSTWKINRDGPVRSADNFVGETYDARKEIPGWNLNNFDDSAWDNVTVYNDTGLKLVPQINQPVRILETLEARSVTTTKEKYYLFDVGENIAGWCNIQIEGQPGDRVVIRHGEILDENGELYTANLGAAIQTDTVTLGMSGKITYEPRFTYHGFRYVEVRGLRSSPEKNILKARVIASDQPRTGRFECSNPMLNQLYRNINRSHISNMTGVPTDCPQRDERCGWMGDVYIFAQTAMFNRDMAAFFNKWIIDIMDAQSMRGTFPDIAPHPFAPEKHFTNAPGWADAAIRLPYLMYVNYGDKEVIVNNFEAFERYIANIAKNNPDLVWRKGLGLNYGDWLNGNTLNARGFPKTGAKIPSEVFSTIMFYNSVRTLSKMAAATGKSDKADYYSGLAEKIKTAFARTFVDSTGMIQGDAQSCYAMALYYDIYPQDMEKIFEKRMIDKFIPYSGRMNTGFHSTLCLMKELVRRGYEKKAFELLETTEFPSWGYSIEQGATSIWERWDGYVKGRGFAGAGMNSFNHYAFGAIGEWMYENIIGIQPDPESPGFVHFILKPRPGGSLIWARGSYESISGTISAGWKKEGNRFEYEFTVPANTSATVYVPGKSADTIIIDGLNLPELRQKTQVEFKDGYIIFIAGPGSHKAVSEL